jgi:hypothetical protein
VIPSDYVISSLATLMYNEPKDDLILGYTVCGLIVRNRVMAGWEGGNWLRLIESHDRYSADPPASPRVLKLGDPNHDTIFRRCLGTAEQVVNGRERDITEGGLWYGRLNECSDWFKENIVRSASHQYVATVGRNAIFK